MRNKYVLFFYLQLLDVLTTVTFLRQGMTEMNPLVRWALTYYHTLPTLLVLIGIKVVFVSAWFAVAKWIAGDRMSPILTGSNVIGAGVVLNNILAMYFA